MGYQGKMNNEDWEYNRKADASSRQRTSKTTEVVDGSSKSQYSRLGQSNKVDTSGVTAKYNTGGTKPVVDNEKENQSSVGRVSGIKGVLDGQSGNSRDKNFSKTGPMNVDE